MLKIDKTTQVCPRYTGILLAMALAVPACSFGKPDIATVPAHPTFEIDVKPLLADHCLLCHSDPATRGAPTSFRLDVYTSPAGGLPAAFQEAGRSIRSIQNGKMPPSAAWGDGVGPNGKAMLRNWASDGYPD
jgi:hypothetical protein